MRMLALAALLLSNVLPDEAPARTAPTPADRFSQDCARFFTHEIPALEARYRMKIQRGTGRIARATWNKMDRFERARLHWPLAFSASCPTGKRGTYRVRIVDETGRELAFQMISTKPECHGDRAAILPEDVEYPC